MLCDAGLVKLGPEDYGKPVEPSRRNLYMAIRRPSLNAVPEPQPMIVDWGRIGITPNGQAISLGGTGDAAANALDALDKAGARGAAALGAAAGIIFSSHRITGGIIGGLLGYFGGKYMVNFARKILAIQQAASTVAAVTEKVSP